MICLIQKVLNGSVSVSDKKISSIKKGYVVFVGIEKNDNEKDISWCGNKIINIRLFEDENGKLNHNIKEVDGEILSISQFTLAANLKKGNRPSFDNAMKPEKANTLYEEFKEYIEKNYKKPLDGAFQNEMIVSITNQGPTTIIVDSNKRIYNNS